MPKLAINGGPKIRTKPFPKQDNFDHREKEALNRVMDNGRLSGYRGAWCEQFYGGEEVKALESEFKAKFNSKYAIACNSATSGLQIACGAVGLAPGDEVIVTPWSMSCSATAPLLWNAVPVFADIEYDYYCLDADSIENKITDRTKAIIIVDLFGQPYNVERINAIAKKHNLMIIEDAAQAIGSYKKYYPKDKIYPGEYNVQYAGTFGDIGVYSFNYGKHITCGEGGIIVTDNEILAMRCRLIMNHAEAVINDMNLNNIDEILHDLNNNMLGFNMRMTELQACVARVQLEKFDNLLYKRLENIKYLHENLSGIYPIIPPLTRMGYAHTYYVQSFKWCAAKADGIHRDRFIEAVKAELTPIENRMNEGVPLGCGYIKPLYLFPIFQNKMLYGGFSQPFKFENEEHDYNKGICPITEQLWKHELFLHRFFAPPTTIEDLKDVVDAFNKVWEHREEIK
jgi:dTDP-4-amino-4,6-dideoxygalactose transaminase